MFFESSINYNKNKLCIYGFRENKEIQYMNMRSIVLEISAFKFFGRGCSKIVCPKTCFLEQTFFGAASAIRIFS
ncbi:Conserved hypothetical protein [Clostridium neonatale]|nr:Conserved hypothetical protein [Clostridium neonatale]CAI3643826.1 Conserved hypothetical protein [Clostridium neonatale]